VYRLKNCLQSLDSALHFGDIVFATEQFTTSAPARWAFQLNGKLAGIGISVYDK
jgi:hypothetical protein